MESHLIFISIGILFNILELMKKLNIRAKSEIFLFGTFVAIIAIFVCLLVQVRAGVAIVTKSDRTLVEMIHPLLSSLATAFFEEFIFRVLLLSLLFRIFKNNWIGILVGSIIFALPHAGNSNVTTIAMISHFLGGLVYSYAYFKTKRIWLPFGLHFGWNYTQIFFGVPMSGSSFKSIFNITFKSNELFSGGLYGFEGGIPSILMRILILLFLIRFFYKTNFITEGKEGIIQTGN